MAVSQLLGLTLLGTTGAWLGRYRGGVAWHSPLQFNAHPLCMVLAMVFLQGDGEQIAGTSCPCCSLQSLELWSGREWRGQSSDKRHGEGAAASLGSAG